MEIEIWKPVFGYEGLYEVSNHGNFRSVDRNIYVRISKNRKTVRRQPGKTITPWTDKDGYSGVRPSINGKSKSFRLHRLEFQAFHGYMPEEVNHLNGIKSDNMLTNLEDSSRKSNAEHASINDLYKHGDSHVNSKISSGDVLEIVSRIMISNDSLNTISLDYNCSNTVISNINNGKAWARVSGTVASSYPIRKNGRNK